MIDNRSEIAARATANPPPGIHGTTMETQLQEDVRHLLYQYELAYDAGSSDLQSDYHLTLDDILPPNVECNPRGIAAYIAELHFVKPRRAMYPVTGITGIPK